MDQYIGRLLDDRYEILEIIGTGGMAVVYKARCHRLNRLVAIKILKDEFARDEEFRRRFHAEGEAVAMLSHPNIVQVYDVSSSDSANFIVMELIDGISLKQYMETKGVLNWKETLHFAMQIAKGLEHAHSRGIVHRDIKPHNVMVLKNGSVKVMDFGIARVMNKSNTLTKEALGSVHYISPEQAKGGHTDNRSDLYSLSVVMYEMITGRPPYDGESAVAVAIQHINGGAPMPSTLNPNIPGGLEQIIMKGMSLEPRDRYASAGEMLQDMEEFRKNPAILFAYQTTLDEATRTIPQVGQPKTVAERKVQARTGVRASTDSAHLRQAPQGTAPRRSAPPSGPSEGERLRQTQKRRKTPEQKKQEERSRVATTAIVICSAVAVTAILIFLVALFNGALLNRENQLVEVPYLVGKKYTTELEQACSDFVIRHQPQQYDDTYAEGQIMQQTPLGGSKVQKGSDIWITISMGAEPPVKVMDNLIDLDAEQTKTNLESQGYVVHIREEASSVIAEGKVIRTDPASGAELTQGQSVYLYVSTGPEVETEAMPDVMGLEVEVARKLLEQLDFTNVRIEGMESSKPEGQVIYQSVEAEAEIDLDAEIIIHYSLGEPETEPSTEATVPIVTIPVVFNVPAKETESTMELYDIATGTLIHTQVLTPGTTTVTVDLTGSGSADYGLYIDGAFVKDLHVEFMQ